MTHLSSLVVMLITSETRHKISPITRKIKSAFSLYRNPKVLGLHEFFAKSDDAPFDSENPETADLSPTQLKVVPIDSVGYLLDY